MQDKNLAESHDTYDVRARKILKESWNNVRGVKLKVWLSIVLYAIASTGILVAGYAAVSHYMFGYIDLNTFNLAMKNEDYQILVEWVRWLALFPIHTGILLLAVNKARNLPLKLSQIFLPYRYYFPLLGLGILLYVVLTISALISTIGDVFQSIDLLVRFLDLVVVLFFALLMMFASLLVVEKKLPMLRALKNSFYFFTQHWIKIIAIVICFILPYFIVMNILIFAPRFMTAGVPDYFRHIWLALSTVFIVASVWLVPMYLNIIGLLYKIMFDNHHVK